MELKKIAICGSVDDGKSTLLGRLMFELGNYTSDKLEEVERVSKKAGKMKLDYSLFTDGLMAEREQGITIVVAHLYMTYKNTRIIWADAPGHEQYTRNMVTAASGANAALILSDVSRPMTKQFRRHLDVLQVLRIPRVLVCVNKLDLVNNDTEKYEERKREIEKLLHDVSGQQIDFVPVSALEGLNLIELDTSYFKQNQLTVLSWIDSLQTFKAKRKGFYGQIQAAIHQGGVNRSYQTWIYDGALSKGDVLYVGHDQLEVVVQEIQKFGKEIPSAHAGEAINIILDRDVDISRGSILTKISGNLNDLVEVELFNLDNKKELVIRKSYLLKQGIFETKMRIEHIDGGEVVATNERKTAVLRLASPLATSVRKSVESSGFILIDESSNATCALGILNSNN
jgi:sulfate adenylyltransferase subunit 1